MVWRSISIFVGLSCLDKQLLRARGRFRFFGAATVLLGTWGCFVFLADSDQAFSQRHPNGPGWPLFVEDPNGRLVKR